jgi:hypothetical protein
VPRNNFANNYDYDLKNVQLENQNNNNNNNNEDEETSNAIETINKYENKNNEKNTTWSGGVIRLPSPFWEELENLMFEEQEKFYEWQFNWKLVKSIKLKVKLPMEIQVDNKGAKVLVHNWSIGGRIRHVGVRLNFLRELEENGIIKVKWIKSEDSVGYFNKK